MRTRSSNEPKTLDEANREIARLRDALQAIADGFRDEPYASDFALDILRGKTADDYARAMRSALYEGEG